MLLSLGEAAIDVTGARLLVLALIRVHLAQVSVDRLAISADLLSGCFLDTNLLAIPVASAHLA